MVEARRGRPMGPVGCFAVDRRGLEAPFAMLFIAGYEFKRLSWFAWRWFRGFTIGLPKINVW